MERKLLCALLGLCCVGWSMGAAADEDEIERLATNVRIDTGYSESDPNPHYVDLAGLREMSIKAYMEGGNYDDLGAWGVSRRDMSLSLCFTILGFAALMTCCCFQCQKHLMKDFYKLEAQARKEADDAAAIHNATKED